MTSPTDRFVFGRFELDLSNCELLSDGEVVKLPPQPFKALSLLVRRAGTLVTRDELKRELWGADDYVDFTAGLNFCMAQLRQALDDPAAESRYILAVPRRGYKFVAAVRPAPAEAVTQPGGQASSARRLRPLAAAVAAIAGVLIVGVVTGLIAARPQPPREATPRPLAAVQRYERASSDLSDASPRELLARVRYFEEALAVDPAFAEAYAGLADAKLIIAEYRAENPTDAYALAKAGAAQAIALDGQLGHAHAVFAAAAMFLDWNWQAAASHFERAVALAPNSGRVHALFSRYLSATEDHERAIREAARAVELAPGSPSARTTLGVAKYYAGRFNDAIEDCNAAASLMPAFDPARFCAAAARAELTGDREYWRGRAADLLSASPDECLLRAVSIASALTHTGRHSEALDWLERAANRRVDSVLFAAAHPGLQPLRADARFTRVLERIGRN